MNSVTQPPDLLLREGQAQRDRILEEVMHKLFELIPTHDNAIAIEGEGQ